MLHLRVITPTVQAAEVVALLRDHAGVAHVVHLRGVALHPEGDLVESDVARESVDEVLARLCEMGIDHDGAITLETVETTLSDAADAAQQSAPGDGADAVVWEELLVKSGEESRLSVTFLAFLTIACLLAAVGVVTDSPVTIVGAMVVGPEFGPLAALAVAVVARRGDLAKRALLALGIGFVVAMAITAGSTILGAATGLLDDSSLNGHEVDFVYRVGPFSLIIALLAGAAGMLSMTSAKSAALVGVFISANTVPAAGYAVLAAVAGDIARCLESLGQLAVNMVGISLAATVVLLLRRRRVGLDRPLTGD